MPIVLPCKTFQIAQSLTLVRFFRIYSLADVQIKLATHANDMQYLKSARGVKTYFKHLYKLSIIIG